MRHVLASGFCSDAQECEPVKKGKKAKAKAIEEEAKATDKAIAAKVKEAEKAAKESERALEKRQKEVDSLELAKRQKLNKKRRELERDVKAKDQVRLDYIRLFNPKFADALEKGSALDELDSDKFVGPTAPPSNS